MQTYLGIPALADSKRLPTLAGGRHRPAVSEVVWEA